MLARPKKQNHVNAITTKKQGYPSVLKTTGIAPKSAGIGSKFLSRGRRTYTNAFESIGIGGTYSNVLKSADIGLNKN